jgi:hypothetical protein
MLSICLASALFIVPSYAKEGTPGLKIEKINNSGYREKLRLQLFKKAPTIPACKMMKTHPTGKVDNAGAELNSFLALILKSLKEKDHKTLTSLFHKRLKVNKFVIKEAMMSLDNTYVPPLDITLFKLWALNTVDGTPKPLGCGERFNIYPLYGYNLQFGVWLQVMGQKELGRIYLGLVPTEGRWNIGSFHKQQWTHDGKDFISWTENATKTARTGDKMAAWVFYDLATKLLDGGGFLDMGIKKEIEEARNSLMTREEWDHNIKPALKEWDVGYLGTLFVNNGAGILVRLKTKKEVFDKKITTICKKVGEAIMTLPWTRHMQGVRCSFVLPKENPKKEGFLGGVYLSFDEIKTKMK